jgi:hypothetical protein
MLLNFQFWLCYRHVSFIPHLTLHTGHPFNTLISWIITKLHINIICDGTTFQEVIKTGKFEIICILLHNNSVYNDQASCNLFVRALQLSILDLLDQVWWSLTIHGAPYGVGGAKDLSHDTREIDGVRARSQHSKIRAGMKTLGLLPRSQSSHNGPFIPSSVINVLHGDVAVVLDVLHLLTVSVWLLKSLDDKGSCGRTHCNL